MYCVIFFMLFLFRLNLVFCFRGINCLFVLMLFLFVKEVDNVRLVCMLWRIGFRIGKEGKGGLRLRVVIRKWGMVRGFMLGWFLFLVEVEGLFVLLLGLVWEEMGERLLLGNLRLWRVEVEMEKEGGVVEVVVERCWFGEEMVLVGKWMWREGEEGLLVRVLRRWLMFLGGLCIVVVVRCLVGYMWFRC